MEDNPARPWPLNPDFARLTLPDSRLSSSRMATSAPQLVVDLVERFESDRKTVLSPDYQGSPNPNPHPLAPNPSLRSAGATKGDGVYALLRPVTRLTSHSQPLR